MTFIEFIGFIIVMLALFFLMLRRARDEKYRRDHPEEFEQELKGQQLAMREFLESLNIEVEEEKPPPPPPVEEEELAIEEPLRSKVIEEKVFENPHKDVYAIKRRAASRARDILKGGALKDAVILHEIIGPPKALK